MKNDEYPKIGILQRLSLSKQLQYGVVAVSLMCVLLTCYFVGIFFWSSYTSLLIDNQLAKLNIHVNDVNFWLNSHLEALRNTAKLSSGDLAKAGKLEDAYNSLLAKYIAIQSICLYNPDQSEVLKVIRDGNEGYASALDSGAFLSTVNNKADYIGKVYFNKDVPLLNIYIPVLSPQGEIANILHSVINLSYLAVSIKSIPLENYGYAYVIDEKNNILASNFTISSIKKETLGRNDYFLFLNNATPRYYRGLNNHLVISSFRVIKTAQWFLVIEYPITTLLRTLGKNFALMFIALISAIMIGIIGVKILYANISAPLNSLISAADRIRGGDLDVNLEISANNELGSLGHAFNTMTDKLSKSFAEIRHQLAYESLTAELSALYVKMDNTDIVTLQSKACELVGEFCDAYTLAQYYKESGSEKYVLTSYWHPMHDEQQLNEPPQTVDTQDCQQILNALLRDDLFCSNPFMNKHEVPDTESELSKFIGNNKHLSTLIFPFREHENLYGFQVFQFENNRHVESESNILKLRNLSSLMGTFTLKTYRGMKLQETTDKLSTTLNSIGDAVLASDTDGIINIANPVAARLLERSRDEIIGSKLCQIMQPVTENGQIIDCTGIESLACKYAKTTHYVQTKSGRTFPVEISTAPLLNSNGLEKGHVVVFRDISDRLRVEAERIKMERHEALGYLAAGMAHDFNNLLSTVMGSIGLAKLSVKDNPKATSRLSDTEKYVMQGKAIAEQLFMLDKNADRLEGNCMLQSILKQVSHMALYKTGVEEEYDIEDNLPPVRLTDGTVNQILANLVINAAQAMQEGGKLIVRAKTVTIASASELPLNPGEYVQVNIIDNGPGIDADTMEKVFLPYFTTKERGTGLGIPMVLSLATRYGGYFRLSSVPGQGTDAELYFPVA